MTSIMFGGRVLSRETEKENLIRCKVTTDKYRYSEILSGSEETFRLLVGTPLLSDSVIRWSW